MTIRIAASRLIFSLLIGLSSVEGLAQRYVPQGAGAAGNGGGGGSVLYTLGIILALVIGGTIAFLMVMAVVQGLRWIIPLPSFLWRKAREAIARETI